MAKLVNHRRNDDAVSPVIGVMLMIVVTVVIAAVVALFATNVVTSTEAAPVVVMEMNAYSSSSDANSKLVMSTRGGDPLDLTKLKVVVSDSTGDYGLSFVGLDQRGLGDHLEIGEKLTVFTLANIGTVASSASGGNLNDVVTRISGEFKVGNKIHVMVTFNENAVIYEKDIVIKAGTESQTAEVTEVLKTSTSGTWVYIDDDETPVSSKPFTITYGTTEVSIPIKNDTGEFKAIRFSKGLEGSMVENNSCVVGMDVDDTNYEIQVNGKTLTMTPVTLKKGDMISVVKKAQVSYSIKLDNSVKWTDVATGNPAQNPLTINEDGMYVGAIIDSGGLSGEVYFGNDETEDPKMIIKFELDSFGGSVTDILLYSKSIVVEGEPTSLEDLTLIDSNGEIGLEMSAAPVHTLTFNPGSGTGEEIEVDVVEGGSYTMPCHGDIVESFTPPSGYLLNNWGLSGSSETYEPGKEITVNEDMTFTANWFKGYKVVSSDTGYAKQFGDAYDTEILPAEAMPCDGTTHTLVLDESVLKDGQTYPLFNPESSIWFVGTNIEADTKGEIGVRGPNPDWVSVGFLQCDENGDSELTRTTTQGVYYSTDGLTYTNCTDTESFPRGESLYVILGANPNP